MSASGPKSKSVANTCSLAVFIVPTKGKVLGFSLAKDTDVDGLRPVGKKSIAAIFKITVTLVSLASVCGTNAFVRKRTA